MAGFKIQICVTLFIFIHHSSRGIQECATSFEKPGVCIPRDQCVENPPELPPSGSNQTVSDTEDIRREQNTQTDSKANSSICPSGTFCCSVGGEDQNEKNLKDNDYQTQVPDLNLNDRIPLENSSIGHNDSFASDVSPRSGYPYHLWSPTYNQGPFNQPHYTHQLFPLASLPHTTPRPRPRLTLYDHFRGLENLLPKFCQFPLGQRSDYPEVQDVASYAAGGEKTTPREFPWMVGIIYNRNEGKQLECGGSLITRWHVLTAAHCIHTHVTQGYIPPTVRLGTSEARFDADCDSVLHLPESVPYHEPDYLDVKIKQVFVHEDYRGTRTDYENDIALLELSFPVYFNEAVRPICLPINDDVPESLQLAGWGESRFEKTPTELLKLRVAQIDLPSCQNWYNGNLRRINSNQICTYGESGDNFCRGDSGGPLMDAGFRTINRVYGIVSHRSNMKCGNSTFPGVYTRVSSYLSWIADKLRLIGPSYDLAISLN